MNLKKSMLQKTLNVLMSLAIVISQTVFSFDEPLNVFGLDNNIYIAASNGNGTVVNSAIFVDPNIDVDLKTTTVHTSGRVYGAQVVIENYVSGDVLGINGLALPSSNISYNAGKLTFADDYSEVEIENLFRRVTFTPSTTSNSDVTSRSIKFELGVGNKFDGHYYLLINHGSAVNYNNALSYSANTKHFGLSGYLISPNTAIENTEIKNLFNQATYFSSIPTFFWIGIDNKVYSNSTFTAQFSTGPLDNTSVSYFAWETGGEGQNTSEPLIVTETSTGKWRDVVYDNPAVSGYGIEYGGMAGDPTPILSATKTIDFSKWTISYNANGATSGTTPSIQNYRQINNGSATIATNSGNLVKSGYSFIGWNSSADGSGILYQANQNINLTGSLTLYAQWVKTKFDANPLVFVRNQGATMVDPNLEISGLRIKQLMVSIEGAQTGDALSFDNLNGLSLYSLSGNNTQYYLLFSTQYQNASVFQTALRSMKFNTSSTTVGTRTISVTYSNNEHGYGLSTSSTDWNTAKNQATAINALSTVEASKQAYLATITSQTEQDFIKLLNGNTSSRWIGLNKSSGSWKWETGPETGTLASTNNVTDNDWGWVKGQPDGSSSDGSFWGSSGGWDDLNSTSVESIVEYGEQSASFTSFTRNVNVSNLSVTYQSSGHSSGSVPVDSTAYTYNQTVTVKPNSGLLTKTNYTFSSWTDGLNTYLPNSTFSITKNTTLSAVYTPNAFSISYVLSGGSTTNPTSYTIETPKMTLTDANREGYTFLGWYSDAALSNRVYEIPLGSTGNKTFYAKWSRYITFAIPSFTSTYRYVTDLFVYSGTSGASTLIESDGRLRINPATTSTTGGVFFGQKLTLPQDKAFSSHFSFKIANGNNSADGFVYILSSNQASTASFGGGLGYQGMNNSVAIVFDTYPNTGDPTPNSISLVVNGNLTSLAYYQNISDADFLDALRYVWVDYDGTNIKVYYNKTNNIFSSAIKVIDYPINLNNYLTTDDIYVGFTGATGGSTQDNSIYSWYFDSRFDTIKPENTLTPLYSDFTTFTISNPGEIFGSMSLNVTLTTPEGSPKVNESVELLIDGVGSSQTLLTNSVGLATFTVTNPNTFNVTTTKTATISTSDTSTTTQLTFKPTQNLSFNSNGGSSVSMITTGYGQKWIEPTAPTKTGSVFAGWYTDALLTSAFDWNTVATSYKTLYAKWTMAPIQYLKGSQSSVVYTNSALTIDAGIQVNLNGDDRGFTQAKVSISSGLSTGDVLSYTDASNTFTTDPVPSYNSSTGVLSFSGVYTSAQWQAILRDVKFSTTSTSTTKRTIRFEMVQTAPSLVIDGKTHYYEFVNDTSDITWTNAKTAAESKKLYGLNGYLVTIKSAEENTKALNSYLGISNSQNPNHGWIGANDNASDGVWKWVTGPETGQQFWSGFINGSIWNNQYNNWHAGAQPNTNIGSDYVIMSVALVGLWGNFPNDGSTYSFGYIVEYGGYEADVGHITTSTQDITFSSASLSFSANGATSGSVPGGYSQRLNTVVSIPTNSGNLAKTGYTFAGWNTQADGLGTNYAPGANFSLSLTSQTLYAKWTINAYKVNFNSNGGSAIATQSINYNLKATKPTDPSRSGYTFAGWYTDNTTFLNAFDFMTNSITQDLTLYAKWTLESYTISYNLNNGSNSSSNPNSYTTTSSTITLADPSKDHYSFDGWYLEPGFVTKVTQIPSGSTGNKTLYAKFSPISYSISYNLDGGSASTISSYTIESNTITLPNPSKVGYTFSHWIDLNNADVQVTEIPQGSFGNQSLKAIYSINQYALSFNVNGGTAVSSQSISYNDYASLPTNPTKTGYTFNGWYKDSALSTAFDFNTDRITTAQTLYASWEINAYTLSFVSNGGSSVASQTKNYQQSFTQPSSPTRAGYQFEAWYIDDETFNSAYDFSSLATQNTTVYAKWLIEVSYDMNYPNIATPSLSLVEANGTYNSLKSVGNVRPGYTMLGWYTSATGGTLISSSSNVTNNTPHTLYAHWGLMVSLDKQDGSALTSYGIVKYGSTYAGYESSPLSLPTPTRTGYIFDGWFTEKVSGTKISTASTVNAQEHHTLYAHWSSKTPLVSFNLTNGGSLGSNPSSFTATYDQTYGSSLVVPTRTEDGKFFLGWYTNLSGGTLITASDLVAIETNHTLYAQWGTYESFMVTYHGNGNTSGSAPSSQSQFKNNDYTLTIASAASLVKTGYTFNGWNTQADGTGTAISVGTLLDTDAERVDQNLYARWSPNQYTVTLDKNDGSNTKQNISVIFDASYSNLSNPFSRTGFTFSKWLDSNNQEITSLTSVSTAADHTLFAQWNPITYLVSYFAQGGKFITLPTWFTGVSKNEYGEDVSTSGTAIYSRYYGGTPTVTKTGYVFKEWNSAVDESGIEVTGTNIVNTASDHTYYAIWTPATNTPYTVEVYREKLSRTGFQLDDTKVYTGTTDSSVTITAPSYPGYDLVTENLSLNILPNGTATKELYYELQNRTFVFDAKNGTGVSTHTLKYGQNVVQPTDPTRTGYSFAGWYSDDTSFKNAYDFNTAVTTNTTVYAKWTADPYTLSYDLNGGSATVVSSYTIESSSITLPSPSKTGYIFVSWHTTSNFSDQAVTQITLGSTGNKTFYAKYSPISYSISYTLNGGTATTLNTYTIESSDIDLPTPIRSGYSFVGWYDNANFTGSSIPSIPEGSYGNKAFYAKWTTNAYTLTYNLNGGSASTVSSYTIETPSLTLPTPIKTGYNFVRWENGVGNTVTSIPQGSIGNQSFIAIYTPVIYSITYNLNGGSASTVSTYTIESNRIDLPSPTKVGYTFNRWIDHSNNTVSNIPSGSIGNRDYTAIFDINSYSVSFNTNGGSSINPASVVYNTYLTQPQDPVKDGYTFEAWYEDASFNQAFDFSQSRITNTKNLYAKYTVNTYTLSYELDGGLATNPSTYTIISSNIVLNRPTKTGFSFVGWYDTPNFTGNDITQISTGTFGNKTLYAKFENALFSLNYDANGGFFVPETDVIFGETIPTLPIPRRDGYRFEGWFSDVALSNRFTTTIMPSRDLNLYAKWSLIQYGLTYDTQGGVHSNPSTYSILNGFNLSPASRPGYVFEGWTLFGNSITEVQRGSTGELVFVAQYRLAERMGSFANFSLSELTSESASFSFALGDEGNPRYTSFRYTLNHPNLGTVQSGSINGSSFTLSGLEAYVNYSITLMATNGLSRIETSLNFTPRLTDTDKDGIPDVRDAYPNDPKKSYNTENLNPELTPVRALVADNNTSSEVSIRIDPKDLMGTSASDTILLVMGSTQFVIPVAILDSMIAKSLNEETYLSLKVEPQLLNTDIPEDLLDPENSTIVKAFDYLLMQVDQDGNETQIHELGGKIKIGVDLNTIVGEYDPENLEVYYYDPEDGSLQVMSATYDPINHSMVFMTDHFSYYVLGVKKENDPTKTTLQVIFLAISLIIAFVYWFKKNFNIVKK